MLVSFRKPLNYIRCLRVDVDVGVVAALLDVFYHPANPRIVFASLLFCRDEFLREDEGEDGSLNAAFKGVSRKEKAELLKVID